MKRLFAVLALLALPLAAQVNPLVGNTEPKVQKLFVLKYADPEQIRSLIGIFGNVTPNSQMHALAVSATPEAMTAIDDAIKRLDVPSAASQNVELTAYLLIGSQGENAAASPLPKDLDGVVAQLKTAFSYKNYNLMDVLSLRTRAGQQASTSGMGGAVQLDNVGRPSSVTTSFTIESANIASDGTVRINRLSISSRVEGNGATPSASIRADVDLKEGQKVVVGKTGMTPNAAVFVVLTAHVAQ